MEEDGTMSPECQALCDASAGMELAELSAELLDSGRVADSDTLAAYLLSMSG